MVSSDLIKRAMKSGKGTLGLYVEEERQQRASLMLRDVRYRIFADLVFDQAKDSSAHYSKYTSIFERRAKKGQCFNQPYLGCREFSCHFRLITEITQEPYPIDETRSLGWMLYDLDYSNQNSPSPRFFYAQVNSGVINVPAWDSEEVRR